MVEHLFDKQKVIGSNPIIPNMIRINKWNKWNKLNKKKFQKKWRFWRIFKIFFKKKKITKFDTIQYSFNKKRIIWHQMKILYGKKIKKLIYSKNQWKVAYNNDFFNCLVFLELRLNVLLLRIKFVSKLLISNFIIKNNFILVNNNYNNKKNYIVKIGDVLSLSSSLNLRVYKRRKKIIWRKLRKLRNFKVKNFKKICWPKLLFWRTKNNLILNFILINYKVLIGILLRKPLIGEILIKNNKRLLCLQLLKKIYFLY